jgi:hypothetical protein
MVYVSGAGSVIADNIREAVRTSPLNYVVSRNRGPNCKVRTALVEVLTSVAVVEERQVELR